MLGIGIYPIVSNEISKVTEQAVFEESIQKHLNYFEESYLKIFGLSGTISMKG